MRCPSASTSFEKLTLECNLFKFWKNLSIVFGVKRTECHPHTGKVCEAKYTHTAKVCEAKYAHTGKACGKVCVIHIPAKYVFMNWLIDNVSKIGCSPHILCRYMDDIFCAFDSKDEMDKFFQNLHKVHSSVSFSKEVEADGQLTYLDVLLTKNERN